MSVLLRLGKGQTEMGLIERGCGIAVMHLRMLYHLWTTVSFLAFV